MSVDPGENGPAFRILAENLTVPVVMHSDGRFAWANQAAADLLGYASPGEIIGQEIAPLIHPGDRDQVNRYARAWYQGQEGLPSSYEVRVFRKDGSVIWTESRPSAVVMDGKSVVVATVCDVTEARERENRLLDRRRQLEKEVSRQNERLEEAIERFDRAMDTAPVCIAVTTIDEGRIVEVNDAYCEQLGYSREELVGSTTREVGIWVDPGDREAMIRQVEQHGRAANLEVRVRAKSGDVRTGHFSADTITMSGKPHLLSLYQDVTELRRAEDGLSRAEKRYRDLVRQAPAAIFQVDFASGRFFSVNEGAEELFGYSEQELLSSLTPQDILTPESLRKYQERWQAIASGRAVPEDVEYQITRGDGQQRWIVLHTDVEMDGPTASTTRCVAVDITQRKNAEDRLKRRVALEEVLRTVSTRFISVEIDNIEQSIREALELIGDFAGAERSYIYLLSEDATHILPAHVWTRHDDTPALPDLGSLPARDYVWLMDRIRHGSTAVVPDVARLPDKAAQERTICAKLGARSLMLIPLTRFGGPSGLLAFDATQSPRVWEDEVVTLVECAAEMFVNALERRRVQGVVQQRDLELEMKSRQLEEVNHALRSLLQQSKDEAKRFEQRLVANVEDLVLPYVRRLGQTELQPDQKVYINVIRSNLEELVAPFMRRISSRHSDLTPREIEVANLVRMGATSREISKLLDISKRAVEFHRDSLRSKLGIKNRKRNLRAYLASLE